MPVYDGSDAVATVADADREAAWRALLDVDLLKLGREVPVVGMLGALRMLPEVIGHLLHGERPAKPPESRLLRDLPSIPMYEGGWILLGERPGEEIALGLVSKFWRLVIEFVRIGSADDVPHLRRARLREDALQPVRARARAEQDTGLRPDAHSGYRRARGGFAAIGRSASVRARISSSARWSIPRAARPRATPRTVGVAPPWKAASSSSARRRFQEWVEAGVFEEFWRRGLLRYGELKGIDWEWLALDGAQGKAPLGGEETGPNPTDRARRGRRSRSSPTRPASRWGSRPRAPTFTTRSC